MHAFFCSTFLRPLRPSLALCLSLFLALQTPSLHAEEEPSPSATPVPPDGGKEEGKVI